MSDIKPPCGWSGVAPKTLKTWRTRCQWGRGVDRAANELGRAGVGRNGKPGLGERSFFMM